jgi:hypothetical protein
MVEIKCNALWEAPYHWQPRVGVMNASGPCNHVSATDIYQQQAETKQAAKQINKSASGSGSIARWPKGEHDMNYLRSYRVNTKFFV